MAQLSIRATFPLGTFLGHRDVGHRADIPDTARLFSALVNAAGQGSTAVDEDGTLRLSLASLAALRWLEEHPPDALTLPDCRAAVGDSPLTWRADGVRGKKGLKKQLKRQSDAVAVSGSFGWSWADDVPADIVEVIDNLCADISCLGEADSPVVVDLMPVPPTHRLDLSGSAFPRPGGTPVRSAQPGRLDALLGAHQLARPIQAPTLAADQAKSDEEPSPAPIPAAGVRDLTYRPLVPPPPEAPWSRVVLLHVVGHHSPVRIRVAVATHQALIRRLGDEVPALITGKYGPAVVPPANRIAIQYLESALVRHLGIGTDVIALLIPASADAAELVALKRALGGLTRIYSAGGELQVVDRTTHETLDFWFGVPPDHVRLWRPLPSLVPETRRQRSTKGTHQWSLVDAAMLSIAYVMRDILPDADRVSRRAMVEAMRTRGVSVHETHALADSRPERHAHKVPDGQMVLPYTALLNLATVAGPHTLMAAGQSRHLGGGLLVPEDILLPVALARGLLP